MAFTGKEGGAISLAQAKTWTRKYRKENPGKETIRAHFLGKEKIEKLLAVPGAIGLRIYFGIDEKDNHVVALVATGEDENNILPEDENSATEEGAFVLDNTPWCPPWCPPEDDGL